MILKKEMGYLDILKHYSILKKIGYINKSGTKYIIFLKYLIEKGVLELEQKYSTNGICKYYKIQLDHIWGET